MKLDVKAMAISGSLLWGGAVLTAGLMNFARPKYGREFLQAVASIYPGYTARREPAQVALGAAYATLDGAAAGAVCAWLYNRFTD